jgi:hypothetical protein
MIVRYRARGGIVRLSGMEITSFKERSMSSPVSVRRRRPRPWSPGTFAALLAVALSPPAGAWIHVPFDTTTASVMQGVLEAGPNRKCEPGDPAETVFPGTFVFNNGDPGEDHLYNAYTLYNNGPERCVKVRLVWTHQDCGNVELGVALYTGSFHPADPRVNLLSHSYDRNYDFFDVGHVGHPNDFRYSPGYYRMAGLQYHLDDMVTASAIVPALSTVVVVVDSHSRPGDNQQCPVNPATSSLALEAYDLDETPLAVEVHDTSSYEFDPPGGATLAFYVSLSTQFNQAFTVDYATSNGGPGGAIAGSDYTTTTGQLAFAAGETTKIVHVPIVSDTSDETPPASESMTLTLSQPSSLYVALAQASAAGTIHDDDSTAGVCSITNWIGDGDLPVGKVGVPYGPVDLRAFSAGFDPTLDYDWSSISGTLPPGVLLGEASIEDPAGSNNFETHGAIAGTPLQAGTYTFNVHVVCPIDDPDPGTPPPEVFDAQFTIVIEAEGPQAILTLPDVTVVEGHDGLTPVLMTIHLSQALSATLPLEVVLFDGSAAVDEPDYLQLLAIPQPTQVGAGTTTESFDLDVVGDLEVEPDETFLVQLRTPIEHTVLATATVTIVNDDAEVGVVEIPTLGDFGAGLFALGLLGMGWRRLRRNGQVERKG